VSGAPSLAAAVQKPLMKAKSKPGAAQGQRQEAQRVQERSACFYFKPGQLEVDHDAHSMHVQELGLACSSECGVFVVL
jgi:hypothetical protein